MSEGKIPGFFSKEDSQEAKENTNSRLGYSRKLEIFKPINIRLLVNLSDIEPGYKEEEFKEEDREAGTVCQMQMTPDGSVSIGSYGGQGNGTQWTQINSINFQEGVHFVFE